MIKVEHKPLALVDTFKEFMKSSEVSTKDKEEVASFILQFLSLINAAHRSSNILEKEKQEKLKSPSHLLKEMGYESEILLYRFKKQAIHTLNEASSNHTSFMKLLLIWPIFLDLPYFHFIAAHILSQILKTIEETIPEMRLQIDTLNPLVLRKNTGQLFLNTNPGYYNSNDIEKTFSYFSRLLIDTTELDKLSKKFLDLVIENNMLYRLIFPLVSYDNDIQRTPIDNESVSEIFLDTQLPLLHKSSAVYYRVLTSNNLTVYSLLQNSSNLHSSKYQFVDTILTENVSVSSASKFFKNYVDGSMEKLLYKPRVRIVFRNIIEKIYETFDKMNQLSKSEIQNIDDIFQYLNDVHHMSHLLRFHDLLTCCGVVVNEELIERLHEMKVFLNEIDQKIFNSQPWKMYIKDVAINIDERVALEFLHQVSTVRASIFNLPSVYENVSSKDRFDKVSVTYRKAFSNDLKTVIGANPNLYHVLRRTKQELHLIVHCKFMNIIDKNILNAGIHEPTSIIALAPTILSCIDNVIK